MMMTWWRTFILTCPIAFTNAFVNLPLSVSTRSSSSTGKPDSICLWANRKNKERKESLVFQGDYKLTSDSLKDANKDDVVSFFRKKDCRDLLLSAGGTRPLMNEPRTRAIEAMWIDACQYYGYDCLPRTGDVLLSCDSNVQFPSLTITTTACCAVRLVETEKDDNDGGLPVYMFLFVAEKQRVSGSRPAVWLFNRLTGTSRKGKGNTNDDDCFRPPSAYYKTLVSLVEHGDSDYAFQIDCKLNAKIEFPAFLIRVLPVSKAKMEEQGSAALLKAAEKDIKLSMDAMVEVFTKWRRQRVLELV